MSDRHIAALCLRALYHLLPAASRWTEDELRKCAADYPDASSVYLCILELRDILAARGQERAAKRKK